VIGKGYNVKDESGNLKEIVGIVVHLKWNETACNIQIAHNFRPYEYGTYYLTFPTFKECIQWDLEYGQADHFVKLESVFKDLAKLTQKRSDPAAHTCPMRSMNYSPPLASELPPCELDELLAVAEEMKSYRVQKRIGENWLTVGVAYVYEEAARKLQERRERDGKTYRLVTLGPVGIEVFEGVQK